MFDWARGTALKRFIDAGLFMAGWEAGHARWLKNWHTPWLLGLVKFTPEMSVLDVGSSRPWFMKHLHKHYGCEVHALDVDSSVATNDNFGFAADVDAVFPEVTMHVGLAGDGVLPAERFDVITCISTLEHTYDNVSPLHPKGPLPHLNALRDMARMLKPGGLLLMNWDMYLSGMRHHVGWDYEVDCRILQECGMRLASDRRILRGAQYLFDHSDTVFFDHEDVLHFEVDTVVRGTAINVLWRKPGDEHRVPLNPRAELDEVYFPAQESQPSTQTDSPHLTTEEIDQRFQAIISRIVKVLKRRDSTGHYTDKQGRIVRFRTFLPFGLHRRGEFFEPEIEPGEG
jgi:SAM-dependent methyltransferase